MEHPSLAKLEICFNADGWGPMNGEKVSKFGNVPYLHFDKKDKISRPADFVSQSSSSASNYPRSNYIRRRVAEDGLGGDYFARHEANEEKSFQLVDTSKTQQKHKSTGIFKNLGRFSSLILLYLKLQKDKCPRLKIEILGQRRMLNKITYLKPLEVKWMLCVNLAIEI